MFTKLTKKNYIWKENIEQIREYKKLYNNLNSDKGKHRSKENYEKNKAIVKEKSREYYTKNKDSINNKRKEKGKKKSLDYYHKNKKTILAKTYHHRSIKMKIDSFYKLKHSIRNLIRSSLKRQFTVKSKKTIEILGCSFDEFKLYLESKFDDKMNWENQGTYWHMDHIIPISSAKTEEEVYKLNHWTNFQPLYWKDNLTKGNKLY